MSWWQRALSKRLLAKMEREWDRRARENPRHYIASQREQWSGEDFLRSGRRNVEEQILTDMENICQGRDPRAMRVIEIGCGAGRLTHALAGIFGEVHGVDVSGEMVRLGRETLRDVPNAFLYHNNGKDLAVLPPGEYHFAFSYLVFQHIPSREVMEDYIRELGTRLAPGALFKFQAQGRAGRAPRNDTWFGAPLSATDAAALADRCGFEARYMTGAGTEEFWLWFFRKTHPTDRHPHP